MILSCDCPCCNNKVLFETNKDVDDLKIINVFSYYPKNQKDNVTKEKLFDLFGICFGESEVNDGKSNIL